MKLLSKGYKESDSQPQKHTKKYEEDQYICINPTITEKRQYYANLVRNPHTLMRYFLTLYDKQFEKQLTPKTKSLRDQAESVAFWSSVGGRAIGISFLARKLSILNGPHVNPLRDLGILGLTIGGIYLMDSLPIAYYWPYFECTLLKRDDANEVTEDPYASANLDRYKVWYYQRLY